MSYKEFTPFEVLCRSPVWRSGTYACNLLRAVFSNLVFEIRSAPLGVRRLDYWKDDPEFLKIYAEIKRRTSLNSVKLYVLYRFARDAIRREGDVAELGVYRGGSARLLAEIFRSQAPQKKILLCDTFEGMPTSDAKDDIFITNDLSDTDYEEVKRYMGDFDNVVFYKGRFSETFPAIPDRIFSFVHVDCDLYGSVLECCDYFYPKMADGGVILFDDYGFLCAPGAKKAVEYFFSDKPEFPIPLPTGQCVVIKQ